MQMTRTYDDETDTVVFSIRGFEFTATVVNGVDLPPHLRGIQIGDKGGVVEGEVVGCDDAEAQAKKMLFNFYKGSSNQ